MNPTQNDEAVKALLERNWQIMKTPSKAKTLKIARYVWSGWLIQQCKRQARNKDDTPSYLNNEIIDFDLTTVKFTMTPILVNHTGTFKQDIYNKRLPEKKQCSFRIVWNKYADGWKIQHMSMTKDVSQ